MTASDKKVGVDDGTYNLVTGVKTNSTPDGFVDYYNADVITANDYYPGGMLQPGRKYQATTSSRYRFSINGQEKESDINENITSALYWEYDSRVVRRWNRDPKSLISVSPYSAFLNNPIVFVDPLGDTCINGISYDEGKGSGITLEEVQVKSVLPKPGTHAKVAESSGPTISLDGIENSGSWENAKDILGNYVEGQKRIIENVVVFTLSAVNSFATNQVGGAGRYHPATTAGVLGAKTGDAISVVVGVAEFLGGGALMLGGGTVQVVPVIGTVAGGAAIGLGAAAAGHSIIVIPTALTNLLKTEDINDEAHTNPPDNMGKPKGGTPGNNQAQNQEFRYLANKYNLSQKDQERLHRYISKQGYSKHEIEEIIINGEYK